MWSGNGQDRPSDGTNPNMYGHHQTLNIGGNNDASMAPPYDNNNRNSNNNNHNDEDDDNESNNSGEEEMQYYHDGRSSYMQQSTGLDHHSLLLAQQHQQQQHHHHHHQRQQQNQQQQLEEFEIRRRLMLDRQQHLQEQQQQQHLKLHVQALKTVHNQQQQHHNPNIHVNPAYHVASDANNDVEDREYNDTEVGYAHQPGSIIANQMDTEENNDEEDDDDDEEDDDDNENDSEEGNESDNDDDEHNIETPYKDGNHHRNEEDEEQDESEEEDDDEDNEGSGEDRDRHLGDNYEENEDDEEADGYEQFEDGRSNIQHRGGGHESLVTASTSSHTKTSNDKNRNDDDDHEEDEDGQKFNEQHSIASPLKFERNKKDSQREYQPQSQALNPDLQKISRSRGRVLPTKATKEKQQQQLKKKMSRKMMISNDEYKNLELLIEQFCKVPFLAEFSRPVSFLHPELVTVYRSIVKHPMDLAYVCRRIRRRRYNNVTQIRVDMWRIFSNCVKFHSHPSAKENAIPSFISIALHMREYFNSLWQEYMLPSSVSEVATNIESSDNKSKNTKEEKVSSLRILMDRRDVARQTRLAAVGSTPLSYGSLRKASKFIDFFLQNDGRVDALDKTSILSQDDSDELVEVRQKLSSLQQSLLQKIATNEEYTVDDFTAHLRGSIPSSSSPIASSLLSRLNRILGKLITPIYEMSCRGVNQSSIWGCMAAAIWARESSKKKYWPALVLGILAPMDQREDWHKALTERNESRLPQKLASDLRSGKRKAENLLSKNEDNPSSDSSEQMSYFLVEFMGKHEFTWVREADIIENFDPARDPNVEKKKKSNSSGASVSNARLFATAVEEGKWALEEFEMQLRDPCGDLTDEEADDDEEVSYAILCQSDPEEGDAGLKETDITTTDDEEAEELLSSEGLLDLTTLGRKKSRKRLSLKRKQREIEQKREKVESAKRDRALAVKEKNEMRRKMKIMNEAHSKARVQATKKQREKKKFEKMRQKEEREQEKIKRRKDKEMKDQQKSKRRKSSTNDCNASHDDDNDRRSKKKGIPNKRLRAESVIRHYVAKAARKEESGGLDLPGIITAPPSNIASYGLLGMALSFRAGAGIINVPDCNVLNKGRPWENIDVDSQSTSKARCKQLRKQIEMIKKGILKLEKANGRKKELIEEALVEKKKRTKLIVKMDRDARATCERFAKVRKKAGSSSSRKKSVEKQSTNKKKSSLRAKPREMKKREDTGVSVMPDTDSDDENNTVEVEVEEDIQSNMNSDSDQIDNDMDDENSFTENNENYERDDHSDG